MHLKIYFNVVYFIQNEPPVKWRRCTATSGHDAVTQFVFPKKKRRCIATSLQMVNGEQLMLRFVAQHAQAVEGDQYRAAFMADDGGGQG